MGLLPALSMVGVLISPPWDEPVVKTGYGGEEHLINILHCKETQIKQRGCQTMPLLSSNHNLPTDSDFPLIAFRILKNLCCVFHILWILFSGVSRMFPTLKGSNLLQNNISQLYIEEMLNLGFYLVL